MIDIHFDFEKSIEHKPHDKTSIIQDKDLAKLNILNTVVDKNSAYATPTKANHRSISIDNEKQ